MTNLHSINNQELLGEVRERVKNSSISEKELKKLLEVRKQQRLTEYELAANDPEEQEELKDWEKIETEGWDE